MGGMGSGPYGGGTKIAKRTTGECYTIDIRSWQRQKALESGTAFVVTFGQSSFILGVKAAEDNLILYYKTAGEDDTQSVELDKTMVNYGVRKWFLCPSCGRRKAVLHLRYRYFACRSCHDLNYASSQYSGSIDYYHHQLRILSKRLGAEYNAMEMSAPPRPKGMHYKTYFDLAVKYHRLVGKREAAFLAGAKRIMGWR